MGTHAIEEEMSTYEVCPAHIRYLIDLGHELGVGSIVVDGQRRPVDLGDRSDRQAIGAYLLGANLQGTSPPDSAETERLVDLRRISASPNVRTLDDLAQALQWVRSYCYQASHAPGWPASAARSYTDQLRDGIEVKIIRFFDTRWDYAPNR